MRSHFRHLILHTSSVVALRKNMNEKDQMADAGFHFQQWSFPLQFLNFYVFCFLSTITSIYTGFK